MRKAVIVMLTVFLLSTLAHAAGNVNVDERSIVLHTRVTQWGQLPERFEITGQTLPEGLSAASFHHVELAVMEDETYAQWLFAQARR